MARGGDRTAQSDEHNARGIELADRGWLEEAEKEFRKAIDLDPQSAHAHDNLATVLAERGDLLEALVEYVEALRADPTSATAHHYLASFLAAQGHDLAVSQYRRAIELETEFADAHLNLAMALADRGQLDEALKELEISHDLAPDDEMIRHELACCLIDLEKFPDAIGHLKYIIKNYPDHVEAYVDLGIAYTAQGFYAEAESTLCKALEIDQVDFATHYHLSALYSAWDRREQALQHLEQAATQDQERLRMWLRDDRMFDKLRKEDGYRRYVE